MNGDLVAPEKDGYIYGITGGNAYVDSKTTEEDMWEGPQVVDGGLKGTVSGINDIVSSLGGLVGLDDSIINAVGTVDTILDKTTAAEANTVIDGAAGLHLQNYGHDWVRYYGAVGGDISVNTGLGGSIKVLGTTDILKKATETNIVRNGDVSNQIDSGSVIGGIGGSAAVTVGNVGATASLGTPPLSVDVDVTTNGKTSATINGNVITTAEKDANVIGWMNGGAAAAIGGTAASTVNGDTTLTIDGTDRADHEGNYETPGTNDILPQLTTALNVMKGSKVNAIGVLGGGTAVTTLGGTATATVGGTSTINANNATVLGMVGGGAAASVDATGAVEGLLYPDRQIGNDDGTSDTTIASLVTVTVNEANEGGTAESTTGDTYLNITGDSTVIGAVGGGIAAASQTYTYKKDGTYTGDKTANLNDAWGASNATATTGHSHITVNLPNSQLKTGDGWNEISQAVGGFVNGIKNNSTQADSLEALDGKGGVFGIFGGGVAVGQGSLRGALSEGNGATAIANTAGSDIDLQAGYAAAVFGGGAAVTVNNARAEANMTDDVNITTGSDMTTVGIFGGGTAISMEGEAGSDGYKAKASETLAQSAVKTVNITNNGDTDGIFGGGMAIGNSLRNGSTGDVDDAVTSVETANITVNGGTVSNLDMNAFMQALQNDNAEGDGWPQWSILGYNASGAMTDARGIMNETSIAAGGLGMGMSGSDTVETANITVNGGTIEKDILGGGIAIDNAGEKGGAHVGTSTITLNGGTVGGSVYAGGAVNGSTPGQVIKTDADGVPRGYDASGTSSTVDTATVNLNGTEVTGEISGQGYQMTTNYNTLDNYDPYDGSVSYTKDTDGDGKADVYESVTDSTLNITGTNTLSALDNTDGKYTSDSKIHDFDTVNVAAGSVTKLEGLTAGTGAALIDGGKVTVDNGAKLDISALTKTENNDAYHIAVDTTADSTFWDDTDFVYDRLEGFATGTTAENNSAYDVTYKDVESLTDEEKDQAADSMAGALEAGPLAPTIRDGFNKNWDTAQGLTEGGVQFFRDWSNNAPAMNGLYGRAALFGEDAAVTGNTVSIARAMADNVVQRLSFTDDYVQDNGWVNEDGGIWAKYIHRKYETDGMGSSFGGIHSSTDYDGAIVGVDFAKTGKVQYGAAIHYGSGDGHGVISRNDYDAYGIALYGSIKDEAAGTNLMADIGWMTTDNDIDGTVNGKKVSADRDVDAWTIGVRGEKEFVSGRNQIVPYVGLRYMSVNPGAYSMYYDGKRAFDYDADNQSLWLLPVGVSFRNETVTGNGWRITPKLDLSYIWAFGDTDTEMTANIGGANSTLYYDVMDDDSWLASLGIEATKDVWSFGVGYGYQKGDDTKDKTWFVNASYAF